VAETTQNPENDSTFVETLLGPEAPKSGLFQRFAALPLTWRVVGTVAVLSALLYLPYLGAVGLWDAWESHYGEVAREMIQRNNYVFPFWESMPFYSKPPLLMWMDVLGFALVGTAHAVGKDALYTEWGMRLPVALFSIASLCLFALALARTVGKRVAYAATFALATMPLYFLLSRQVITDTPFECAFICAMACAIIGLFDKTTKHRTGWWYGFYVFCGLATLAKELIGVALPGAILVLYALLCVLPWDWRSWELHLRWLKSKAYRDEVKAGKAPMPVLFDYMYRMRLGSGLLIFAAVALPWLIAMICCASGIEKEGETFVHRYFIHDQFGRLASGVHTTEHDTPFTYFLQQGGYAIFPWVALIPGALFMAARSQARGKSTRDQVVWIGLLWTAVSFVLVAVSATKFPHYIFPALPGLALLIGVFVHDLWEEGIPRHAVPLILGLVLFVLVAKDISGGPNPTGHDYVGVPIYTGGMKVFTDLIAYNHDRPYPIHLMTQVLFKGWGDTTLPKLLGNAFLVAAALGAYALAIRSRFGLFSTFATLATLWALWFSWGHWVDLSHHWTQRDLFWRYYDNAKPGEPIAAFQMDWKGETFYSRNTVKQITPETKLAEYFALPGRKWSLVEQGMRLRLLQQIATRGGHQVKVWDQNLNAKLVLVSVD
jgi:4-amino-4-deoxy-L-arabinose transferase-like glycosyltransferase